MHVEDRFGCERCWPPTAEAAWEARKLLAPAAELIDESHLHVQILACGSCQQHFLSVFTETIDWADGDDPQHWSVLPLTEAEQRTLCQRGPAPSETTLHALAPDRRSLHRDHPKAAAPHTAWGTGVRVGPHD